MKSGRNFYRFLPPFLKAQYFSREGKNLKEQCTIFNISRKGVGLKFHTDKKIKIGTTIHLEVFVPRKSEPISVKGIVTWVKRCGDDFTGGIELSELLEDVTWAKPFLGLS